MENTSKAVYLGNINGDYCGFFTVGGQYDIYDSGDDYIEVIDDDGCYRQIKNKSYHKFKIKNGDCDCFITETECAVTPSGNDKKPELRYYINGHEVDMIEFANVRYTVDQLDEGGVKCDTIKFEVKFE